VLGKVAAGFGGVFDLKWKGPSFAPISPWLIRKIVKACTKLQPMVFGSASFFGVFFLGVGPKGWSNACVAGVIAASEVERSGTERYAASGERSERL
jgi:hypothetical protein